MLECRDDIRSDMSVFHRIDFEEVELMPAGRYFALALRLPAYAGAVQVRRAAALAARPVVENIPAAPADPAPARAAGQEPARLGPRPGSKWTFATAGGE